VSCVIPLRASQMIMAGFHSAGKRKWRMGQLGLGGPDVGRYHGPPTI
jgi:hypothetical protein